MTWTEDASNWHRAGEVHEMSILIHDLIRIGAVLGVDVAERVYLSLRDQPRTAHGDIVDWLEIRAAIDRQP